MMRKWGFRLLKLLYVGLIASLPVAALANYTATVGSGTNFGSVVIGGVHFMSNLICDMTTANQCAAVSAGGAVKVDGSAATQPVSLTSTTITGTVAVTESGTWTVQPGNTANTTPWLMSPSTGGNTAAVKAASTAPAASDPALVVSISPNSVNANGQAIAANSAPVVAPVLTVAGAAVVKGGVPVVNGGSGYQAVAASQTAAVLQSSTGATGDYLSHCVIYPASTSPGVVTVFDNTNTAANSAILFAGGATSTSNLAPIPVPVGAVSTGGAWKVTTGANVSVVCYGKFS